MERFLSYDRLIAYHRNRLDVKPYPKDKLNMAYLNNKFNQFMLILNNTEETDMIKKVIEEIYNQLQNGDEVYKYSIEYPEVMDKIFDYMLYFKSDEKIRILSSQCFKQFCMVLVSKEQLNNATYLKLIHKTFDDESEAVRINVYQGLIYYAQSRYGIDTLLQNEILQRVIDHIPTEKSIEALNLILDLTNEILNSENAPDIALENEIIFKLKLHINSSDNKIKENVILNYASISLCESGKKACVEEGSLIRTIINYLRVEGDNITLVIACTRFLMSVSILKRGKVEIYENSGLEILIVKYLIFIFRN